EQLHVKDEGGIGRDDTRVASSSIGHIGGAVSFHALWWYQKKVEYQGKLDESSIQKYGEAACQVQRRPGFYQLSSGFGETSITNSVHLLLALRLSQPVHLFRGQSLSQIVALSTQNFDWGACIQPDEYEQTYAKMPKSRENTIPHHSWVLGTSIPKLPIRQASFQSVVNYGALPMIGGALITEPSYTRRTVFAVFVGTMLLNQHWDKVKGEHLDQEEDQGEHLDRDKNHEQFDRD
ncbi:hypothetical protein U0070_003784, partial [Myodes glareolus]